MRLPAVLTTFGFLLLSACETVRATTLATPKERVTECEQVCTNVGLKFSALVVIANSAGCVCEPKSAPTASTTKAGASAASGGAVIAAAAAVVHANQQNRQLQPDRAPIHR